MKILFTYPDLHRSFRSVELSALSSLLELDIVLANDCDLLQKPYAVVELPLDSAMKLLNRSLLIKNGMQVWASGSSYEELHFNLKLVLSEFQECFSLPWGMVVESYGRSLSATEKLERIELFNYLPLTGPVDLSNPSLKLRIFEHYADPCCSASSEPIEVFIGCCIGTGQRSRLIDKLNLKKRLYIGNTSMDPLLSLLMANLAKVDSGKLVFDPFVGTGSLLLAAAQFRGYTFGADINYNVIHGRGKPSRANVKVRDDSESILNNFVQTGVETYYLDVLISDASKVGLWHSCSFLDAIITDPPYGLREKTVKVGFRKAEQKLKAEGKILSEEYPHRYPNKTNYDLIKVFLDLLNFAATYLVISGRLVYWYPVQTDEYHEDVIPQHPCLALVGNCVQKLSSHFERRCLVLKKTNEPKADDVAFVVRNPYDSKSFRDKVIFGTEDTNFNTIRKND